MRLQKARVKSDALDARIRQVDTEHLFDFACEAIVSRVHVGKNGLISVHEIPLSRSGRANPPKHSYCSRPAAPPSPGRLKPTIQPRIKKHRF